MKDLKYSKKITKEISYAILLFHDQNKTPTEIAKIVSFSSTGIRAFLKRNSLIPNHSPSRDRSRPCVVCGISFIPKYDDGIKKDGCKTCSKKCLIKLFASYKIKYTQEQINEVIELKKQNISNKVICQKVGININKVKEIVKKNKLYISPEQIQRNAHTERSSKDKNNFTYDEYHQKLQSIEKDIIAKRGTAHGLALEYGLNPNSVTAVFRRENKLNLLGIKESTGQKSLHEFVISHMGEEKVFYNDKTQLYPKELDVYVPHKNLGIEYNGLHWHTENKVGKNAHYNKMKLANEKGIRLITIFEHEWLNREKQVKNFLKSVLGISEKTISGRNTEIKEVEYTIGKVFMEENHIQGASNTPLIYFGIYLEEKLFGAMSLGKHHRGNNNNVIVLDRLCFLDGVTVHGGASKLFKYASEWAKKIGYTKIISWSDNRWSKGNVYQKMRFVLEKELKPDYFYIKNRKVFSKQSLKKKQNEKSSGKTESQLRAEQGYERVYDCGKKRWIFSLQ